MSTSSGSWHSRTCEASSSIPAPPLDNIILFLSFFDGTALPLWMGKAKKAGRGSPPTKKLIQPTILEAGLYPAITRPMSLIGKHTNVPGSYWPSQGQNRAKLVTLYQCVVTDYTSVHVFPGGRSTPAWRMQEIGVTGHGLLSTAPVQATSSGCLRAIRCRSSERPIRRKCRCRLAAARR